LPAGNAIIVVSALLKTTPSTLLKTGVFVSTLMVVRPVQPENAPPPIDFTLFGIDTFLRPLQPENAPPPIDFTLFGIDTLLRPLQPENANSPIDFTLFGIDTLLRPLHKANERDPIEFTEMLSILLGISTASSVPKYLVIVTPFFEHIYSKSPKTAANPNEGMIVRNARIRNLNFISF
jgi:hypothetical protein